MKPAPIKRIKVDPLLIRRAKVAAAEDGITLEKWISNAIMSELDKHEEEKETK